MFKNFDRIAKETKDQPKTAASNNQQPGGGNQNDPFASLFAGLSGASGAEGEDPNFDDKQMMDMFKGLMGSLGGEGGGPNLNMPGADKQGAGGAMPSDDQMNDIMKQF